LRLCKEDDNEGETKEASQSWEKAGLDPTRVVEGGKKRKADGEILGKVGGEKE